MDHGYRQPINARRPAHPCRMAALAALACMQYTHVLLCCWITIHTPHHLTRHPPSLSSSTISHQPSTISRRWIPGILHRSSAINRRRTNRDYRICRLLRQPSSGMSVDRSSIMTPDSIIIHYTSHHQSVRPSSQASTINT